MEVPGWPEWGHITFCWDNWRKLSSEVVSECRLAGWIDLLSKDERRGGNKADPEQREEQIQGCIEVVQKKISRYSSAEQSGFTIPWKKNSWSSGVTPRGTTWTWADLELFLANHRTQRKMDEQGVSLSYPPSLTALQWTGESVSCKPPWRSVATRPGCQDRGSVINRRQLWSTGDSWERLSVGDYGWWPKKCRKADRIPKPEKTSWRKKIRTWNSSHEEVYFRLGVEKTAREKTMLRWLATVTVTLKGLA